MKWFKKEPAKPVDRTAWDNIVVHTEAGTKVEFRKNSHYYQVEGDTLYVYNAASAKIVALFPRFSGVNYSNSYFRDVYV